MRAITKLLGAAAAVALTTAAATSANAAIYIALQENNGAIVTVASGATVAAYGGISGLPFGTFETNIVSGQFVFDPTVLSSGSVDISRVGTTAATLDVYVVRDDINTTFPNYFASGFNSIAVTSGWTLRTRTYVNDANNTVNHVLPTFLAGDVTSNLGVLLGDHTFPQSLSALAENQFHATGGGTAPYAVTQRYTITTGGVRGSAEGRIAMHAVVPEPATWALMILGFGSAGAMLRRRRTFAVA